MAYEDIIAAIQEECGKISLSFSKEGDGRITSAIKETEYLMELQKGLAERHPTLTFELQPVERWWWDFRVNNIPFNLKLTTGGTDNAFNKVAILFSILGKEVEKRNMNYNQFYKVLKEGVKKPQRDPMTEYHYLVVQKQTGKVLLKSIFDIHSFKPNPCNDLQINWTNEFNHIDYRTSDENYTKKVQELLQTIQTSVKQAMASMIEFANADFTEAE
jgi:hypothetical protein